jgi:hypothetical protein
MQIPRITHDGGLGWRQVIHDAAHDATIHALAQVKIVLIVYYGIAKDIASSGVGD